MNSKWTLFIFCNLFLGISPAFSQQNKADSLTSRLKQTLHDTDRVNTLNALAWELAYNNPDTALLPSQQALELSTEHGFKTGMAKSHRNLGWFAYLKGDYQKALAHYAQAMEIWKEFLKQKPSPAFVLRGMAATVGNIGLVYANQGDYAKALDHYRQALEIFNELGDKSKIAVVLGSIGIVYREQGDYAKALDHYRQALEIDKELGDKRGMAIQLGNSGVVYADQGDYAKALDHYRQALEIDKELGNKRGVAIWLGNIGIVYHDQDDYAKALDHYLQALEIFNELGHKSNIAACLGNIGIIYYDQSDYAKALDHFRQALEIAHELGDKNRMAIWLGNIGNAYTALGNLEKVPRNHDSLFTLAMEHYSQSIQVADEIGYKSLMATSRTSMARLLVKQHKPLRAIPLADSAIAMLAEMHEIYYLKNAFLVRSVADSALGNWQEACEDFLLHLAYKDSATGTEMQKEVGRTARMWEIRSTEKEIEAREKEEARLLAIATAERRHRQYTWILAIVVTLITFVILVAVRYGKFIHAGLLHYFPTFILLIVIETIMLFADPYIDEYTGGFVFFKALVYVCITLLILPVQRLLEKWIVPRQSSPTEKGSGGTPLTTMMLLCLMHSCGENQEKISHLNVETQHTASDAPSTIQPSNQKLDSFATIMNTRKTEFETQYTLAQKSGNAGEYHNAFLLLRPLSVVGDSVHHYTKAMKVGMAKAESDHKLQQYEAKLKAKEEARISAERKKMRDLAGYSGLFALIIIGIGAVLWFSRMAVKPRTAETMLLLTFFLLFESLLVFSDGLIDAYSGGDPAFKLIVTTLIAAAFAFLHEKAATRLTPFLNKLKRRMVERKWKVDKVES